MSAAVDDPRLRDGGSSLPIVISPMRRRHLRGVLRVEEQSNPRPWSRSLYLSELKYSESRVYLVAHRGHELVGYAGLMLAVDDGHVTNIAVDPSARRQGIGRRLLLVLARRGLEEGARALTLEVRVSNESAIAMYREFGFAPVGVRKGYYSDSGEDAIIMWANDVDTDEYRARLRSIEASIGDATRLDGFSEGAGR